MNTCSRFRALTIALAAVIAVAIAPTTTGMTPGETSTVVVHGTVAIVHYPFSLTLTDGTRVKLNLEQGLLFADDPAAPAPGDEVVAVGRGSASGGSLVIRSAGLAIQRPSGRQLPLPPDPCVVPAASLTPALSTMFPAPAGPGGAVAHPAGIAAVSGHSEMGLMGTVLSVGGQSFELQPEHDAPVTVLVDPATQFINLGSIADLDTGDIVEVRGSYAGSGFQAASVELMDGSGGGEETELTGVVLSVGPQSFELQPNNGAALSVLVDQDTEYHNLGSVADLDPGDTVRVQGSYVGADFRATSVELMNGGGGDDGGGDSHMPGVHMESTGLLTEMIPPDAFRLDDGRIYHVTTTTVYENGLTAYGDLAQGQFLEVEGSYRGGIYTALKIDLEGDQSGGQELRDIEGSVTAVGATSLSVDGSTQVLVTPSTRFDGDADVLTQIEVGWHVEIHALLNMMGNLMALEIRSDDPAPATTEGQDFEPQEALVVLVTGADSATVASRYGAEVAGAVGDLGFLFRWDHTELTDELLARITADSQVLAVEPNYQFRDPESSRKRFPVVDRSPAIEKYLQQAATTEIQLPSALAQADGTGTVVAIMDTGVEPCHPLIADRLLPGGMDVVDGDLEPWATRDGIDEDGDGLIDEAADHGTFVASIIALAAPGAKILPYRVLDDDGGGTAYGLALALADAIDRGVDVINISLTYHTRSTVVDLLLEKAAQRGIVVVAAAGNDPTTTLPFPAVDSHVLAVTALAADGSSLAPFTSISTQPPIVAAPGENIYGALDRGRYGISSGTSMAAPFAAAAAALIKSIDPSISPSLVDQAIIQGGLPLASSTWQGSTLDLVNSLSLVAP
ncbi:MAG: S8 family serine peptidase [Acidobacteria bacterium]|nr:S8 family serine peptidase [Acidobacteriota bacterium]